MSMYSEMLQAAMGELGPADAGRSLQDAWAGLLNQAGQLPRNPHSSNTSGWDPDAIAIQVGYDASLLLFARRLGIQSTAESFDRPEVERGRLEDALGARGYRLRANGHPLQSLSR